MFHLAFYGGVRAFCSPIMMMFFEGFYVSVIIVCDHCVCVRMFEFAHFRRKYQNQFWCCDLLIITIESENFDNDLLGYEN